MSELLKLSSFQIAPAQGLTSSEGLPSWAWFLIIVAIILFVWWLLVRSAENQNEIKALPHEGHSAGADSTSKSTDLPMKIDETKITDDLTLLEGVGPKVNSVLVAAGITSFSILAQTEAQKIKDVLDSAGYKYMDPGTWPEQARLLAEGKLEEFQILVGRLKGGRTN